uniref:Family with sequence similarity 13 member B n=1 Tax=Callorhinchus milii TaxID=7868 RepID=A0A4W3HWT2_CALMI
MRKSFSPSLSNSNSLTTNKIFGVPLNELQQQGHPGNGVPYIVKHIVEYLEEYGVEQEGLFKVNGSAEMVEWLRQKYDSGEEVDLVKEADVSSAVSLLRLFLQELPEAVIPASLHTHLMQLYQDNSIEDDFGRKLKCFLQQLPAVNYNLLKFLCRFLVKVTSQKEEKWTASSLAAVFGLDVFHIYTDVEDMKEQEAASNIMSELLENYNEFFGTEEFLSTDISNSFHVEVNLSLTNLFCLLGHLLFHQNLFAQFLIGHFYDLNANTESDVPARRSVSFRADKVRPEIAPLDLKKVAETCDWEDPVPAFKSWQDEYEHELGEAQLSPQAGRLTSHPLEEDPQPMLCRRYLNFGHSQRFLREPDSLISLKGPTSFRPRRSSFDSKDEEKEEQTRLQLTKKLQSIKKKIKLYEDQFEKERKYKPSHSDKAANPKVLKWMNELVKLRKQMKEAKSRTIEKDLEILPQARPRSNTLPKSFGSCLEHERGDAHHRETPGKEAKPSMEATLEAILNRLKEKRAEEDWPEDIKEMRQNHLAAEKVALQKSLLYFESIHGRPVTREQRQLVKPLYDRYRLVKQILTKANLIPIIGSPSTKRRGQTLQPIIEGETAHFFEEIKEDEEEDDCNMTASFADTLKLGCHTRTFLDQLESEHDTIEHSGEETSAKLNLDLGASSIHAASMPELLEQLWKARADKKKLRKALREFEGEFYRQNGRNVQKEDRTPMIEEYREYKHIKARCRLLEVLISKQDSAKSI